MGRCAFEFLAPRKPASGFAWLGRGWEKGAARGAIFLRASKSSFHRRYRPKPKRFTNNFKRKPMAKNNRRHIHVLSERLRISEDILIYCLEQSLVEIEGRGPKADLSAGTALRLRRL